MAPQASEFERFLRPRPFTNCRAGCDMGPGFRQESQICSKGAMLANWIIHACAGPETTSPRGRFEDVHRGSYDPEQHLEDMALDGVAGEVLYPSQGLFYFKVADTALMSAIFRAYNDWLAEFCHTDPARLKGIAMINLDDVRDGIKALERSARLGLSGAMITEYPAEDRRYDQPEYEPFWAAAAALAAAEPTHGDATAGQDPRHRSRNA